MSLKKDWHTKAEVYSETEKNKNLAGHLAVLCTVQRRKRSGFRSASYELPWAATRNLYVYTCSRGLSQVFNFKPSLQTAYWLFPLDCPVGSQN